MEPPPIPLTKKTYNGKSDKDVVKMKLRRDPKYSTSDLYEFKMTLFDHGGPEEFLLFIHNFNMTLAETGTLETNTNIQYLRTLVCGEALSQFDSFYADVESTGNLNVEYIVKGLASYFTPVNPLSK